MAKILEWGWREAGHQYLGRLEPPYPETCDACIAFVGGDQWRNIDTNGIPTPVINITKRALMFFVAALTSNNVKVQLGALPFVKLPPIQEGITPVEICQAEVDRLFEEWNVAAQLRDALAKAGTLGDSYVHIWFDADEAPFGGTVEGLQGVLRFEVLPGNAVLFGNANCKDIERQPWVILEGRDMVAKLRAEAKEYRQADADIRPDRDFEGVSGDMSEVEIEIEGDAWGKAAYAVVYKVDQDTKVVTMTKCTSTAYIFKDRPVAFSTIPVARLAWEEQEGQFHGRGIVQTIIPNQIAINRMMAMVIFHLMLTAFPKTVYDADLIDSWSNEIGEAIPVHNNGAGRSLDSVAKSLEPGNMSTQIIEAMNLLMAWTKEAIGMTDAALGAVNPEQASGAAIVASAKQAVVPLENVRTQMHSFLERIGRIILDGMAGYYGVRPVAIGEGDQQKVIRYDFSQLRGIWMLVKSDVGAAAFWSEIAQQSTMDSLLKGNYIDLIQFLERTDDVYVPRRRELIEELKRDMEQKKLVSPQQVPPMGAPPGQPPPSAPIQQEQPDQTAEFEQMAQFVDSLPAEIQGKLEQLMQSDPDQYEQIVREMMQGAA